MRHPLHAICPYFAMFPEEFAAKQIEEFTHPGDFVFDPFCGRGTTVFESLLLDRDAAGLDINPVAACVAGAKADAPDLDAALVRLRELEQDYQTTERQPIESDDFFRLCFHPETLAQICFLREQLIWTSSRVDRFIAAVLLGCLHGESHKSPNYLSNRMPRTISTKPASSIRWWAKRGLIAPLRNAFEVIGRWLNYRLGQPRPLRQGVVALQDARRASVAFPQLAHKVDLIVTSPPYLDTTNFREDQWLRLWFLGGPCRPTTLGNGDDRHRREEAYWKFLSEAWGGCADLVKAGTIIAVRIGGRRLEKATLPEKLTNSLRDGMPDFKVVPIRDEIETEIVNRQTNSFRPGSTERRFEYDFVFSIR